LGAYRSGKELTTMAKEETPEGEEECGKRHPCRMLIALLTALGGAVAALMWWRRRGAKEEEGEPPPE
jgi:hypothetical protein